MALGRPLDAPPVRLLIMATRPLIKISFAQAATSLSGRKDDYHDEAYA